MMTVVEQIPSLVLFSMMLAMGMGLTVADFARVIGEPRAAVIGSLGQLVLLPVAALVIARALALSETVGVGLLLIAVCPGGTISNAYSLMARGDVALSISLTAVSSLVSFVWLPAVFGIGLSVLSAEAGALELPFLPTAVRLFVTVCLPVFLGMVILRRRPSFAARSRQPILKGSIGVLLAMIVSLPFSLVAEDVNLWELAMVGTAPVLLLMAVTVGVTGLAARVAQLDGQRTRTLVIEVGIQNFALAMVLALSILKEPTYLGTALIYLPAMLVFAGGVVMWGRRSHAESAPAGAASLRGEG